MNRRELLRRSAGVGAVGVAGVAGCAGSGDEPAFWGGFEDGLGDRESGAATALEVDTADLSARVEAR